MTLGKQHGQEFDSQGDQQQPGKGQQAVRRLDDGLNIQVYTNQDEENRDEKAKAESFQAVHQGIIFRTFEQGDDHSRKESS